MKTSALFKKTALGPGVGRVGLLIAVLLVSVAWSASAANPPSPTYDVADVDGNISEWRLATDYFADMYRAGNPTKDVLSKLYLRYDCGAKVLYALVLTEPGHPNAVNRLNDHHLKIDGATAVDDQAGDDGVAPDFAWYQRDGGTAAGWEASLALQSGSYRLGAHTQVDDDETSAVANREIDLRIICPMGGKFFDANVDAQENPPDFGLGDWTIEITNQATGVTYSVSTAASGAEFSKWRFPTQALAGDYLVQEVNRDGWVQTYPNSNNGAYLIHYDGSGGFTLLSQLPTGYHELDFGNTRLDFGDLPDRYGTTLASNGARHRLSDLYLGSGVDSDSNGQPCPLCGGDDGNGSSIHPGIDDEDGVVRTPGVNWQAGAASNGLGGSVDVTVSGGNGILHGWIDWNRNGSFDNANEHVINGANLTAGAHTLTFDIPLDTLITGSFYARFRLYEVGGAGAASDELVAAAVNAAPTGLALGGEVEDNLWQFGSTDVALLSMRASAAPPATNVGMLIIAALALAAGVAAVRRSRHTPAPAIAKNNATAAVETAPETNNLPQEGGYTAPRIIFRAALKQFSGSPLATDPFAVENILQLPN